MRAGAAALAAFFVMALAPPVPRAAAQCGNEAPAAAAGHPLSAAGALAAPFTPLARAASATATQMPDEAAPLPGAIAPRAYRPYQIAPASPRPLTADTVASSLEARGFRHISAVRQRGQSFLAEATGPRGERVRLVLDAGSGDISGMQVIGYGERH